MLPVFARDNAPYSVSGYGIKRSDLRSAHALSRKFANAQYILLGNLRHRAVRAAFWRRRGIATTSSGDSVADIVGLGSLAQMVRVHTGGIVAGMSDNKPVSTAMMDFMGDAVRQKGAMVVRYDSISIAIDAATPRPAFNRRPPFYLIPKVAIDAAELLNAPYLLKGLAASFANLWVRLIHLTIYSTTGFQCKQVLRYA